MGTRGVDLARSGAPHRTRPFVKLSFGGHTAHRQPGQIMQCSQIPHFLTPQQAGGL